MDLMPNYIKRFQGLYKKKFNQDICYKEAFASLTKLVNLIRLIDKPITKAEFERLQERRKELGMLTQ